MPRPGWICLWMLLLPLLLLDSPPVAAQSGRGGPRLWKTLSGNEPAVIAKGGFSGIFPDSSSVAYQLVNLLQFPSVTFWCDVQMTKDAVGICLPDMDLSNCTNISFPASQYANMSKTYLVNGRDVTGWFTLDYNSRELFKNVLLIRSILSRSPYFDGYPIQTVENAGNYSQKLWLNIQHDLFYKQHNLNMTKYILSVLKAVPVAYISSPEVVFLQNIAAALKGTQTKLILRFPEDEGLDPSTNRSYSLLLKDLKTIRSFASGILIPKNYIWPVTPGPDPFLLPSKSIVTDAHDANLEVFASGFANDAIIAYNYSYNPVSEYVKFIDNGQFSVDGFLSDFPSTAWEAIGCFSHLGDGVSKLKKPLIISHNGDSGDFPACTDLAYDAAIRGGTDVLDCSVQVTKDSILFCLESVDLFRSTTVSKSPFATRLSTIGEIKSEPGIYSFNFTWEEIQNNLKPNMFNPWLSIYPLKRNPANTNAGEFVKLDQFLGLAKDRNLTGVLINIQNAHFLVERLGIDIINLVIEYLDNAGYSNQSSLQVMIQSSNRSTLIPFRQQTKYTTVYKLDELVRDVDSIALKDIQSFADAVAVNKRAIYPQANAFITGRTKIVDKLQSVKLKVYAYLLMNEFVGIPWDCFGDALMEIHNLVYAANVDGLITDFPATSHLYRSRNCSRKDFDIPVLEPGFLIGSNTMSFYPPTEAPLPPLKDSDVLEPPLPPVVPQAKPASPPLPGPGGSKNAQPCTVPSLLPYLAALFVFLWYTK